jgi:hypothetical protein
MNNGDELAGNTSIDKGKNKKIVDHLWKYYENNKKNYQDKDNGSLN